MTRRVLSRQTDAVNAKRLRRDVPFLLACLEFEDVQVRKAAKAALEAARGEAVGMDVNLSPEGLAAEVDALRTTLDAKPAVKR